MPDSFLPKELKPIGTAKFKGYKNDMLSLNKSFTVGKEYPIYDHEGLFVINNEGIGNKIIPAYWTKIKYE
jgi:hypothetical protein